VKVRGLKPGIILEALRGAEAPLFHGTEAPLFQGDAEIFEDVRDGGIKNQVPPLAVAFAPDFGRNDKG